MVSAIITTHNRKDLLKRAIESVLSQTYKDLECIVVDDASTDGTDELCKSYPIQYINIPKEESKGGNYARNIGIKTSKGKYCAFLDDDDYWLPEKIEKQIALIQQMQCELVYCGRIIETVFPDYTVYKKMLPDPRLCGDMHKLILQHICCTTSTILVLRKAIVEVNYFDEALKYWQEYELIIRLAQREHFYFVNECLCVYRKNVYDTNRLTNHYFEWEKSVKYIYNKHSVLYKGLSLKEKLKSKVQKWKDAKMRCETSHLLFRKAYYSLLLTPLKYLNFLRNVSIHIL